MIQPFKRRKLSTNSPISMDTNGEGDEWKPPTEAERKIMEAKRERSNKISQLMGTYLMKGYKMLATNCPTCLTILMRSREGTDYCVACAELSTDVSKDDPALSSEAAERQVAEDQQRVNSCDTEEEEEEQALFPTRNSAQTKPIKSFVFTRTNTTPASTSHQHAPQIPQMPMRSSAIDSPRPETQTVKDSISTVQTKLQWSTEQLRQCENPEGCIQWCKLVQQCADSMLSLYILQSKMEK